MKVLFIVHGKFSNTNLFLMHALKEKFPEYEFDILNTKKLFKGKPFASLKNVLILLKEYFWPLLTFKKSLKEVKKNYFSTLLFNATIKKEVAKRIKKEGYKFTFQTQSLFDCNVGLVPNFVYTDHTNLFNLEYPDIKQSEYLRSHRFIQQEQKLYRGAAINFVMSDNIAESLVNNYDVNPHQVVKVYSGHNQKQIALNQPKDYSSKTILFVGIDWERKGGGVLVEIFKKVLKVHADAKLIIVGCNPKIDVPNCEIIGKVPPTNLPKYFNEASLFCFPTLREPFGIAIIEAMHYQLPVIANRVGAIPEFVKSGVNGFVIDNDIEAYAKAISDLFDRPFQMKQMGMMGKKIAQANYDWNKVAEKISSKIKGYLYFNNRISPGKKSA